MQIYRDYFPQINRSTLELAIEALGFVYQFPMDNVSSREGQYASNEEPSNNVNFAPYRDSHVMCKRHADYRKGNY